MGAVCAAIGLLSMAFGAESLPLSQILSIMGAKIGLISAGSSDSSAAQTILLDIRLPRVLLAGVVGASLALAGAALQGLFRNPMASPYLLGISAGAALGAVAALVAHVEVPWRYVRTSPLAAFAGALLATAVVYLLARVRGRVPIATLLLSGIALGSFLSAVVSMILVFNESSVASVLFWLMGGLSASDWPGLIMVLPYFLVGLGMLIYYSRELNAMLLGEEASLHLGIEVERVKRRLLLATSLLTAAAVSVTGVIGFVGLIVPHMVRLATGPDHRLLVPLSALSGGAFLIVMDTLARSLIAPDEIPVGAITALLGGPFFILLLRRRGESLS